MWRLRNTTPFKAERTWVRDLNGAEIWLVAVKGTFRIGNDGSQSLASEQREISRGPEFHGESGASSLSRECDLVETKLATDVLLDGHAWAPVGRVAKSVDVRLQVANIDKTLRVFGDRVWKHGPFGLRPSTPKPFTKMPIRYEHAFGGVDPRGRDPERRKWEARNPVGVGFTPIDGEPLPNVENPRSLIGDVRNPAPAGFGAIARHWQPRLAFAGTYDERWEANRSPLLPEDFNAMFYQCAPADQMVIDFLRGGEIVTLTNLTIDGFLQFEIPRVTLGFTTRFLDGSEETHRANLHTLLIRPDDREFEMTWHSAVPCHHKVQKLRDTTIVLKARVVRNNRQSGSSWEREKDRQ